MLDAFIDGFDPDAFCDSLRSKFPPFSEPNNFSNALAPLHIDRWAVLCWL